MRSKSWSIAPSHGAFYNFVEHFHLKVIMVCFLPRHARITPRHTQRTPITRNTNVCIFVAEIPSFHLTNPKPVVYRFTLPPFLFFAKNTQQRHPYYSQPHPYCPGHILKKSYKFFYRSHGKYCPTKQTSVPNLYYTSSWRTCLLSVRSLNCAVQGFIQRLIYMKGK